MKGGDFAILLSSLLLFTISSLNAQLSEAGRYRELVQSLRYKNSFNRKQIIEYVLPEQDNAQLLAEAQEQELVTPAKLAKKEIRQSDGTEEISFNDKPPKTVPFKFGKVVPLSINMTQHNEGEWIINEESRTKTWRFKVVSKEAHSISIHFSDFHLAPLSELYVIGREDNLGAFTATNNNKDDRSFAVAPVAGDFLILEYIEPILPCDHPLYNYGQVSAITVSHIVHGFRPSPFSMKAANLAGKCNINVACNEGAGKTDAINSVALLINGKGDSFCTGAMVNNVQKDGRQLFLTAEHCIGDSDVKNFMIGFHYQFKYCNSMFETKPQTNTVHGTKLLDKSGVSDYALLEVVESIPDSWDVFMAGWDATDTTSRSGSFYGIHHPSGDTKKVSLFSGRLDLVRLTDMGKGVNYWQVPKWDKGVTEPGSSGSPLFDSTGNVIGHLLGGESSCSRPNGPDYYGALGRDWVVSGNPITRHLNPNNVNIFKVQGAPLKQLRERSDSDSTTTTPVVIETATIAPTITTISTITVTQTLTKTETETQTQTVAKTTKIVTSKITITSTIVSTSTREVTKTTSVPITKTETFIRNPPAIITTVTVTAPRRGFFKS